MLTDDVRKNVPGSMMSADDIVLCSDGETYMTDSDKVLGDLGEGIRGQSDEEQQTKNPIHGLNVGHDNGQGRESVRGRATKSVAF